MSENQKKSELQRQTELQKEEQSQKQSEIQEEKAKQSSKLSEQKKSELKQSELKKSEMKKSVSKKSEKETEQAKNEDSSWFNIFLIVFIIVGLGYVGYNNQDQFKQIYDDVTAQFVDMDEFTINLDDSNFDQIIQQYDNVLVEFYAPWCGHCKKLAPQYAIAAQFIHEEFENVRLAKIDASNYRDLASKYGVQGFPTMKWFSKDKVSDYTGGRTGQEIINWVLRKAGKASTFIDNNEKLQQLKQQHKVIVVYFASQTEGQQWQDFIQTAVELDTINFYHVTDSQIAQQNDAKLGQVVLFKQFDELRNNFTDKITFESLFEFVNTNRIKKIINFDDDAIKIVFQSKLTTLFLMHDDSEQSQKAREILENLSGSDLRGKIVFAYSTPTDKSGHFDRLGQFLGVNVNSNIPAFTIVDTKQGQIDKFIYEGEIEEQPLKTFIQKFLKQELQPSLKSEEIPEKNDEPVKIVVAKNFKDVVINNDKDVLLEFYAPWCGHCKQLAPEYELAAQKLQSNPNIILAKIDATKNEILGIQVDGFPTIKYFPGNQKNRQVQEYNGDRNAEAIVEWLKSHTTHPWVESDDEHIKKQTQEKTSDL
ncbi:Thioredoxin-like fold [Pseudocohnilembus persalinus]|uniref:Protein disulfide-isomerase n=1 Tax=Pseudocohnilembus persalinus TaxID=266149 RepID=A0A0V0QFG3_PSEPJ|nr:Thioredoxin-like fold [Pseudocohnilembus persalinus]|eukprot:KRX00945.1 Thioredoxin-like fold [Pseudocohnilembus persalinus]